MNRLILNVILPGEPVTWKRAGGHGKRRFNPKHMRNAQARIRRQVKMCAPTLQVDAISRFGMQATYTTTIKGDGDNYQKLLWDALNGVIWQDDEQIDEWQGKKICRPNTRLWRPASEIHLIVYVIEG